MPRARRFTTLLAAGAAAVMIAACATPTPYQPIGARGTGASGGFSDVRLAENRYRVTFAGNSLTTRERVETYLLYRAAELTVQQGFDGHGRSLSPPGRTPAACRPPRPPATR